MKINSKKYECTICKRQIINPVCIECRIKQAQTWLYEQKTIPSENKAWILKDLGVYFSKKSDNKMTCIHCNKNNVSTCTYCFFSYFERLLHNTNTPPDSIDSFQKIFNYQLYEES